MEQSDFDKMTPFDKLISSDWLQMLKLLLPYLPPAKRQTLAIYIKYLELEHTIDFFRHFEQDVHAQAFQKETASPSAILEEIRPFLPEQTRNFLDSLLSIFNMMEMVSAMKDMMPAENEQSGAGSINPMDMMKEMLTPEQQDMFEMYRTMFQKPVDSDMKGDAEHE